MNRSGYHIDLFLRIQYDHKPVRSYYERMKNRRSRIMQIASAKGFNTVAAFRPENVFYLTNFWGEAIAICSNDRTSLVVPKLEASRAQQDSKDCEVIFSDRGFQLIDTFINAIKGKVVCADYADYPIVQAIQTKTSKNEFIVDADALTEGRMIKEENEILAISKAAGVLDDLYEICTHEIKIGLSERILQAKIIFEAMQMGASTVCIKSTLNPLIIASGPNGALPHAQVSDRKFVYGDMVVVDLTLRSASYIADATRTFALGATSSEMKEAYELVKQSQQQGISCAEEGVVCERVDRACRTLISDGGYGNHFIHSTGHGIGLDVHEPPWLRTPNQQVLKRNMAITIEPGIYLNGKFGIRIEDSIIVEKGHAKNLNAFTRDLLVLG
ncbi:MAG TPA: aminopeptidase P family protein [Candidatus Nitrosopolaris sp.]|nr:aminopeptidase P family protein [Candidatus Nitrosopolaris sp.]